MEEDRYSFFNAEIIYHCEIFETRKDLSKKNKKERQNT